MLFDLCFKIRIMKIESNKLLQDLEAKIIVVLGQIEELKRKGIETLNKKPSEDSWSALECFEHVNRYGRFYLPEMNQQILQSRHKSSDVFSSGWLGNYFAKSMIPNEDMKAINTFKSMNPNGSELNESVLKEFVSQQHELLQILEKSRNVDLSKTKTGTSISKLIKLRLGDTLRVVIYHTERHMLQAQRASA